MLRGPAGRRTEARSSLSTFDRAEKFCNGRATALVNEPRLRPESWVLYNSFEEPAMTLMHYIVVREEAPDRFIAYPCGLPELTVTADAHVFAVEGARRKFVEWVRAGKLVPVNVTVDVPPPPAPVLDPVREELHREYVAELARERQLEDERAGIWKVEPGDEARRQEVIETIRDRQQHLKGTIWDYEIPWPDSSSTPTTSPTTNTGTPESGSGSNPSHLETSPSASSP